jgi:hypothetical protein
VVHDNVGAIVRDSVYVTLLAVPATPGAITGNTAPCQGATADYSIAPVAGATSYNWTVPSGASILSGQTTTSISVGWGNTSGNITVTSANSCGNSATSQQAVNLTNMPAVPGAITGPTNVCAGAVATFSVQLVTGVTNNWTVPFFATIMSGQGTNEIQVQWGGSAGFVTVNAQTGTCVSNTNSLGVNAETIPTPAQPITGSDTVCKGIGGYQFSTPVIANAATYTWTLPQGATISQGAGTNTIVVDFSNTAVSGDIVVAGNNPCGTGTAATKAVTAVLCVGLPEAKTNPEIDLYPNPVQGILNLRIRMAEKELKISLFDISGRMVFEKNYADLTFDCLRQADLSGLSHGIYLVRLTGKEKTITERIVIGNTSVD